MNFVSFLIFVVLQILFVPLAIVGAIVVGYRQIVVSKKLGTSQTAIEILNGRWTMHVFGMRNDEAAARIAAVLPNTSTFGLWLCLFPLWAKYKISGRYFAYPRIVDEGDEGIAELVTARTVYFDRIIERALGHVEQFVVMGAGLDTRAYGALKRQGVSCFELDQPAVQKVKLESLRAAQIDARHVTFVEVDFSKESAFDALGKKGYDPSRQTLFLWEGVTLYLNEADVRTTLQDIRKNAAPGSVVVADFYAERFVKEMGGGAKSKTLDYTNEGLGFGLPFATDYEQNLEAFLLSEGMKLGETNFMGRNDPKGPFMVVAEFSF